MKKFLVGLLTVALAASMLVGCGKKEEKKKADNSLKDVQSKKELILGLDASFPPMGFTDKKQNIVGFDIDLAKEVTKRMGIKLKLQPINWDSKEQELDTGKIDCIWNGLTVSPDRKKVMLCSESYMDNHQVLVVPAKSKIKSLKDVKKQTVGVQKGSTAADAVDSTKELKDADNADEFKIKGELLTSYIYMIEKGMESVEVDNFYDENYSKITIALKKNLTPSENAQKYFKKYNKLKTAKIELAAQITLCNEEIEYLENIMLGIENCENLEELADIKDELIRLGYAKAPFRYKAKKDIDLTTKPNQFTSSDGFTIFVGKNNKQNDYLTLRIADPEDLWMHTKNIPGSHVIVKCAGKKVPDSTLLEGAMLAAYFSKARMSSQVPVDYTMKKHVKKPSGSKPGMVIYETNSTIYVTPNEELVVKLKNK